MKRLWLIPIAGLVLVAIVSAGVWALVGRGERLADYYPFEPTGRHWEYEVTEYRQSSGSVRKGVAVFTALGPGTFDGKPTLVLSVRREFPDEPSAPDANVAVMNHFTASPESIDQIAVEWANVQDPRQGGRVTYSPPLTVARFPLGPGGTWQARTQIYSPREGQPDIRTDSKRSVRIIGRERVTVPAGEFDAVRIEIQTLSSLPGNPRTSESRRIEWRTRGIGLVRLTEGPYDLALKSHARK